MYKSRQDDGEYIFKTKQKQYISIVILNIYKGICPNYTTL